MTGRVVVIGGGSAGLVASYIAAAVKSKVALIYGQMTEPPGARLRVGLTGLTVAEHFRDSEGQDVLLFIDNIFRFTQAGSEVSALLGRMPSAVGYQPTLATEMGELQERITSTNKGSITSVQAIYVPADDLTDPAPAIVPASIDLRHGRVFPILGVGQVTAPVAQAAEIEADPLIREALSLMAFEEQRHRVVLDNMIRFYGIALTLSPEEPEALDAAGVATVRSPAELGSKMQEVLGG